jgi:hypothetical protein
MSVDPAPVPFSRAVDVVREGPGRYRAQLCLAWEAGGGKQHGGVLLAVATRAALVALDEHRGVSRPDGPGPDGRGRGTSSPDAPGRDEPGSAEPSQPLAVSASFLRAGATGAAEARTEVLGVRGSVWVVRSVLCQGGDVVLDTTVTAGRLPAEADRPPGSLTPLPPEPPAELRAATEPRPSDPPLASACDVRIDPATTGYRRRERTEPVMRGWVQPLAEPPGVLFALFAGDILPTGLFNFGLLGWAPTVQLTALVRAVPAPGWLRVATATRSIAGGWFDEDVTVVDAGGQLVCQARQLARAPRPRG